MMGVALRRHAPAATGTISNGPPEAGSVTDPERELPLQSVAVYVHGPWDSMPVGRTTSADKPRMVPGEGFETVAT